MGQYRCPHCSDELVGFRPNYDRERDQVALQLGYCTACGADKTDADIAAGHWRCESCAEKHRNRTRRKRGVKPESEQIGVSRVARRPA